MISYKRHISLKQLFQSSGDSQIEDYLHSDVKVLYSSALRLGMLDVLDALKIGADEFVALPPVVPQGLILPLQKKRILYRFYHLQEEFHTNVDSVEGLLVSGKCRALFFIHYFGIFNKQIYCVRELCNKYGVVLLEDFVHGLFGVDDKGQPMGTVGDISVCSFPKFLPVPDGGLFFINNVELDVKFHYRKSLLWELSLANNVFSLLFNDRAEKCRVKVVSKAFYLCAKVFYAVYYKALCSLSYNHDVSKTTLRVLSNIDFHQEIDSRMKAFEAINEQFGIYKNVFYAPGYPILHVEEDESEVADERKQWRQKGVDTLAYIKGWNYVPAGMDFDYERHLQNCHYLLPLNNEILVV